MGACEMAAMAQDMYDVCMYLRMYLESSVGDRCVVISIVRGRSEE